VLRLPGNQQALHGWRLLPAPGAVSLLPSAGPGPGSNSSPNSSPGPGPSLGLGLEGQRLAEWRGLGQGRIGLWPVIDSYALALGGAPDAHAALWSALLAPLARPAAALPAIAGPAIVARRLALCGVAPGAVIAAPDGAAVPLLVDSATGQARCAAFWPRLPGWHRLRSGAASLVFAVADSLPAGIAAREAREATLALVRPAKVAQAVPTRRPGKSWPWFLGFVVVAAGVWWLERSRVGRPGQRFPAPSPAAVRQGQALP
jgi:hypothetical protein